MTNEKTEPTKIDPEVANLILSDKVNAPAAFSPEIASISLRTPSNFLDEGYELRLTSTFGADEVEIETESLIITVRMEILQARIELEFANCKPKFGDEYNRHIVNGLPEVEHLTTVSRKKVAENSKKLAGSLNVNQTLSPGASADISGSLTNDNSFNNQVSHSIKRKNSRFHHASIDRLVVGDYSSGIPLNGIEIADYEGWKIFPTSDARSGVLATLKIKSNWIKLDKIDSEVKSEGGAISPQLAEWLSSFKNSNSVRRDLFKLLLQNLVYLKLQQPDEKVYATLDCAILCVEPNIEDFVAKGADKGAVTLSLRDQIFEAFVAAEDDEQAREIAEHPENFMLPDGIYEFPTCTPAELLNALHLKLPATTWNKTWTQDPIRIATFTDIEKDIRFLNIPLRYDYGRGQVIDGKIGDPIEYIRKRVARVPIIASAIQDIGFLKLSENQQGSIFSKILRKKTTRENMIRRRLDAHFMKVFNNRMSVDQINRKITQACMWVEFVKDIDGKNK